MTVLSFTKRKRGLLFQVLIELQHKGGWWSHDAKTQAQDLVLCLSYHDILESNLYYINLSICRDNFRFSSSENLRLIVLVHFIFCIVILGNVDSEKAITVPWWSWCEGGKGREVCQLRGLLHLFQSPIEADIVVMLKGLGSMRSFLPPLKLEKWRSCFFFNLSHPFLNPTSSPAQHLQGKSTTCQLVNDFPNQQHDFPLQESESVGHNSKKNARANHSESLYLSLHAIYKYCTDWLVILFIAIYTYYIQMYNSWALYSFTKSSTEKHADWGSSISFGGNPWETVEFEVSGVQISTMSLWPRNDFLFQYVSTSSNATAVGFWKDHWGHKILLEGFWLHLLKRVVDSYYCITKTNL